MGGERGGGGVTRDDAVATLRASVHWTRDEYAERRAEAVAAFRVFWASNPTEEEFSRTMSLVILAPEMLYLMVAHP